MLMSALNGDNPVLQGFAFYASILILKMMGMSLLTAIHRFRKKSAVCWPSYGERIAAQFSTSKSTHVRTDTRPSWPHRARTVTDMFSLNFDGHGAVYERHHMLFTVVTNREIVALGLNTDMCGLTVTEPSPHRHSADSRVGHGASRYKRGPCPVVLTVAMDMSTVRMNNPVLQGFGFYASVLIVKMMAMSIITAVQRFRTKACLYQTGRDVGASLGITRTKLVKAIIENGTIKVTNANRHIFEERTVNAVGTVTMETIVIDAAEREVQSSLHAYVSPCEA
ncbi:hypothetical protein J6590_068275 [Homalodisca vitripennis]|nr:hypothetical protein J6590_068275 [Homalodisca vitripennis]